MGLCWTLIWLISFLLFWKGWHRLLSLLCYRCRDSRSRVYHGVGDLKINWMHLSGNRWNYYSTMGWYLLDWNDNGRQVCCKIMIFGVWSMVKHVNPFISTLYNGCNYLSIQGLKLNHVSKRATRYWSLARSRDIESILPFIYCHRQSTAHWSLGDVGIISKSLIFKIISQKSNLSTNCEIAVRWILQTPLIRKVNIGSGNGLVPSGDEPLPESVLTKMCVAIWCH